MKKIFLALSCVVALSVLTACGDKNENINVISREQGSGTRTTFTEIVGITAKDTNGKDVDNTYSDAVVQNSTNAVMVGVANDENAIGYISLGSLNDTVKTLSVDNVKPSADTVIDNSYKITRNFNIVYKDGIDNNVKDFLLYISSDDAQNIVEKLGYISVKQGIKYTPVGSDASITIAGSTSVAPIMEKLVEGYKKLNPDFNADIQATGSSSGIKSAIDGSAQIGMSSRELKDSELSELKLNVLAKDAIAVIVNKNNTIENIKIEQIKQIFEGTMKEWSLVNGK